VDDTRDTTLPSGAKPSQNGFVSGARQSDSARTAWLPHELPDLVDYVMPAVVTVDVETETGPGNGSGFAIHVRGDHDPGIVVTNAHVVLEATEIVVVFSDEETCPVEVRLVERRQTLHS
jgi:S1-C subfamily serine protease